MKNLYIVTLEKLDSRYTKQWYDFWKEEFSKEFNVIYIDGNNVYEDSNINNTIDKGRFLDINKTNIWKAYQVVKMGELFRDEVINEDDSFIFMDGWDFGITALKYMSQLNNINIKIYTYLHAGSWDNWDFITQAGLREWAKHTELGWLKACDGHFVATEYHKTLITRYFNREQLKDKIHVVGFPMDWKKELSGLEELKQMPKKDIIIFPHRLNKEKSPESFDKLKTVLHKYQFITTVDKNLSKEDYYKLLCTAKVVFSASKQETFGIGTVEAMLLGCIPVVPDRLAYVELYNPLFKYNDSYTSRQRIEHIMERYYSSEILDKALKENQEKIIKDSLDAIPKMCEVIKNGI